MRHCRHTSLGEHGQHRQPRPNPHYSGLIVAYLFLVAIACSLVNASGPAPWRRELITSREAGELLPPAGVVSAALPTESGRQKTV
jgi:hypothetical protein